jgi:hypothetical protein
MEITQKTFIDFNDWVNITNYAKEIVKLHKAPMHEALWQSINDYKENSALIFILENRNIDLWNEPNKCIDAMDLLLFEVQNTIDLELH